MRFSPSFTFLAGWAVSASMAAFVHPGLLHTEADFERIRGKISAGAQPWTSAWSTFHGLWLAQTSYAVRGPHPIVYRGGSETQNYGDLYNDIASAYTQAIQWKLTDDTSYADAAVKILDAWATTLTQISGNADRFLAAGIYGYEFANAAEIMRAYSGWPAANFEAFKTMMVNVFYPVSLDFLTNHNGQNGVVWPTDVLHYWANWDLCNIAGVQAIAVLTDNQTMYDYATDYFYNGPGQGSINHTIPFIHIEEGSGKELGQTSESARDQGHATLDYALLSVIAQTAWSQGLDLFGYSNSRILAGSEYMAKYNLGFDVPFTPYVTRAWGNISTISDASRGIIRPVWELLYAHYDGVKGLNASWTGAMRDHVLNNTGGAENGVGSAGGNSGGYDQLGYGTLLFRLDGN
ncbi:hypothetical protein QCA50_011225 [Cerrena zonata]|uniref:Alginate lyase domain-containing protein n=1 Tax=Cerrena zonata TaxID=2478898 RepID=A0AAW0G7C3_9APHY